MSLELGERLDQAVTLMTAFGREKSLRPLVGPTCMTALFALQHCQVQRWGKKWGKNQITLKTSRHKKIQPPLSGWIF